MSTHTPGPWTITHDNKHNQQRISANDAPVAVTKDEANARLIAAAPDLLAALQKVLPLAETYLRTVPGTADYTTAATIAAARAAIAKAEGTT